MKSTLLLGVGLLVLFTSGDVLAGRLDDRNPRVYKSKELTKRGKKGRKYARRFSLAKNLSGDKLEVLKTYGYTPHRLRFDFAGERTERWRYYSLGKEFTFDDSGNLIHTRRIPTEENHIE